MEKTDNLPEAKPVHVYGFGYLWDDDETFERYKKWCKEIYHDEDLVYKMYRSRKK